MKTVLLSVLALCAMGLVGCATKPQQQLTNEATLQQRCAQLNVTCEVEQEFSGHKTIWMGSAHDTKPYPTTDWWFVHEPTRAEAVDKLNAALKSNPTDPGHPAPETLYKAKERP